MTRETLAHAGTTAPTAKPGGGGGGYQGRSRGGSGYQGGRPRTGSGPRGYQGSRTGRDERPSYAGRGHGSSRTPR
jgi:hypothetical protein